MQINGKLKCCLSTERWQRCSGVVRGDVAAGRAGGRHRHVRATARLQAAATLGRHTYVFIPSPSTAFNSTLVWARTTLSQKSNLK